jgi:hypothetical protein
VTLLGRLRSAVSREQFHPGSLGTLVNPFYFARRGLVEAISQLAPEIRGGVLDVGCGSKPYRELFQVDHYVGMDVEQSATRMPVKTWTSSTTERAFRFPTGNSIRWCAFRCSSMYFIRSGSWKRSAACRPGGNLLLTVPFVWDEHEQPYDFARYSSFGLQHLLGESGFTVVRATKTCADVRTLFQLLNGYTYKVFPSKDDWAP